MDSRDFGLEIAQVVGVVNYLHFGYWDPNKKPTLGGLFAAQEKHTTELLKFVDKQAKQIQANRSKSKAAQKKTLRILDIGCGSGKILKHLLEKGYQVDGVIPSDNLYAACLENVEVVKSSKNKTHAANAKLTKIYKCYLEDFYAKAPKEKYDILLFCESFQYINYPLFYEKVSGMLNDHGQVVISDYFSLPKKNRSVSFVGGHKLSKFYEFTKESQLKITKDKDISKHMAPNLAIVDDLLMDKILPSTHLIDEFLKSRSKIIYSVVKFLCRKSLAKIKSRYFSGTMTPEIFNKSKSYRMIVMQVK